jgi:hypothetical protein
MMKSKSEVEKWLRLYLDLFPPGQTSIFSQQESLVLSQPE